jgi:hypothetical protein
MYGSRLLEVPHHANHIDDPTMVWEKRCKNMLCKVSLCRYSEVHVTGIKRTSFELHPVKLISWRTENTNTTDPSKSIVFSDPFLKAS